MSEQIKKFDILGVGDSDIDIMVSVKEFPEAGQKVSGHVIGKYPGGMVANFLSAASAFGAKCHGILCVGDDMFGEDSLNDLKARNIDVSGSVVRRGESTYFTTNCIAPNGEKRMILCFGNAIYPNPEEVSDDDIGNAKILHVTGNAFSYSLPLARRAKKLGTKVSMDLERIRKDIPWETRRELVSLAHIVFPNEEGLFSYTKATNIEDGAKDLLSLGVEIVVVTEGAKGAELFTRNEHYTVPALATHVEDTTGAGDCFNGSFVAALTMGYSLKDCLLLASAVAAEQVSVSGCRTKLLSAEQAKEVLERHKELN